MASLADLVSVYAPSTPAGFSLADIDIAGTQAQNTADIARSRLTRNFGTFDLPDLISSQAARGAFHSSATQNKVRRLATGTADQLSNVELGLADQRAILAANALLAQTGIRLGGF